MLLIACLVCLVASCTASEDARPEGVHKPPSREDAADLVNVAWRRPCAPAPHCASLVSGDEAYLLNGSSATSRTRKGQGHKLVHNQSELMPAAHFQEFASGSRAATAFKVDLEKRVSVAQVVVTLRYVHRYWHRRNTSTDGPPNRSLVVTTSCCDLLVAAPRNSTFSDINGNDLNAPTSAGRSHQQEAKLDPGQGAFDRSLVLTFDINQPTTSVTVAWNADFSIGCSGCGEFLITQIAVLAPLFLVLANSSVGTAPQTAALPVRRAAAMVISGPEFRTLKHEKQFSKHATPTMKVVNDQTQHAQSNLQQGYQMPIFQPQVSSGGSSSSSSREKGYAPSLSEKAKAHQRRSTNISERHLRTTEAPSENDREKQQDFTNSGAPVIISGRPAEQPSVARTFLAPSPAPGLPDSTLAVCAEYACIALLAVMVIALQAFARTRCLPMAKGREYSPLADADQHAGDGPDMTTDDEEHALLHLEEPSLIGAQLLHGPSASSPMGGFPRAPRPVSGSSESEPEGELDPASGGSSPRATAVAGAAEDNAASSSSAQVASKPLNAAAHMGEGAVCNQRPTSGRALFLYASPLCLKDSARGPVPLPQIPFHHEWDILLQAYEEAAASLRGSFGCAYTQSGRRQPPRPGVQLAAQPLTSATLQRSIAPAAAGGAPSVLHLSAHGANDCLVLEDGRVTAHPLTCGMLDGMLELRRGLPDSHRSAQLVILNACCLDKMGSQLARGGVPHVICCSSDLRDSSSHVFLAALYSNLFQGGTVARAFSAAIVALRSDSSPSTRATAECLWLLPEDGSHDVVLFPPEIARLHSAEDVTSVHNCSRVRVFDRGRQQASTYGQLPCEDGHCSSDGLAGASSSAGSCVDTSSDNESSSDIASSHKGGHSTLGLLPKQQGGPRQLRLPPPRRPGPGSWPVAVDPSSPFWRGAPLAPEDFLGRARDVWIVLQQLSARRAVVVCGDVNQRHGVGKSAVLDAVHRAFVLHMDGVCIAVHFKSLTSFDGETTVPGRWVCKLRAAVQATLRECRSRWCQPGVGNWPSSTRRRCMRQTPRVFRGNVRHGFHALTDPIAAEPFVEPLVAEMSALAEICEARQRCGPVTSGGILLVFDEVDHLIQQQHFQETLADILQRCPAYSVVLSTHQRMVGTAGGHFKVVHHAIGGLAQKDAAKLFLRRVQRPLAWRELLPATTSVGDTSMSTSLEADCLDGHAVLNRLNEAQLLGMVAAHPAVASKKGNPKELIELASRVCPSLKSLSELAPMPMMRPCRPAGPLEEASNSSHHTAAPLDGQMTPLVRCG